MKLFLISQKSNTRPWALKSAVVLARNEEEARNTNPRTGEQIVWEDAAQNGYWVSKPELVMLEEIGEASYSFAYAALREQDPSKLVVCCAVNFTEERKEES